MSSPQVPCCLIKRLNLCFSLLWCIVCIILYIHFIGNSCSPSFYPSFFFFRCAITLGSVGDYESPQIRIENGFKFKVCQLSSLYPSHEHLLCSLMGIAASMILIWFVTEFLSIDVYIQEHIERSIELCPTDSTSHYLLGRWCYEVSTLWIPLIHNRKLGLININVISRSPCCHGWSAKLPPCCLVPSLHQLSMRLCSIFWRWNNLLVLKFFLSTLCQNCLLCRLTGYNQESGKKICYILPK